ncbi:hypothetical protein DMUE_5863, partial [Dictyocoela muelleri]
MYLRYFFITLMVRESNLRKIYLYTKIFLTKEDAIEFLKSLEIIPDEKICRYCSSTTVRLRKDKSRLQGIIYKCINYNKKFNILHNTIFIDSRLEIHVLLRV